jgi:hypothetical protein
MADGWGIGPCRPPPHPTVPRRRGNGGPTDEAKPQQLAGQTVGINIPPRSAGGGDVGAGSEPGLSTTARSRARVPEPTRTARPQCLEMARLIYEKGGARFEGELAEALGQLVENGAKLLYYYTTTLLHYYTTILLYCTIPIYYTTLL